MFGEPFQGFAAGRATPHLWPRVVPGPTQRIGVGPIPKVVERLVRELEPARLVGIAQDDNPRRLRLDSEQARIEGSMMRGAEDEAVPRVVGPVFVLRAKVGGVQQFENVEPADRTLGSVALKDAELEPLLARASRNLAGRATALL